MSTSLTSPSAPARKCDVKSERANLKRELRNLKEECGKLGTEITRNVIQLHVHERKRLEAERKLADELESIEHMTTVCEGQREDIASYRCQTVRPRRKEYSSESDEDK